MASLGAVRGKGCCPLEPIHFSPAEQKVRVLQAREQPGQERAVVFSYEDCTLDREEIK